MRSQMWKGGHLRCGRRLRPGHDRKKSWRWTMGNFVSGEQMRHVAKKIKAMRYFGSGPLPRPGWRNWQTQRTQNPPIARSWGFDPPSRHQQNKEFRLNWPPEIGEAKIVWGLF